MGWGDSHIGDARFVGLVESEPSEPPRPDGGSPQGGPPSPGGGRLLGIADEGRTVLSATLQDAFDVADDLTLTAGVRFDHYDDQVVYPQVLPTRNLALAFPGRSAWFQASWSR